MENQYIPLTKKNKNSDGTTNIVCAFLDTERCPIHKDSSVGERCACDLMVSLMREQLNVFEEVYLEND